MSLKEYLVITDDQKKKFNKIYSDYRKMYEDPEHCNPMFIIETPTVEPAWEEKLADPMVMLKTHLNRVKAHLDVGDDRVPTVLVEFGTAQIAAAFGCDMYIPQNNLPCAGSRVLKNAKDIYDTELPSFDCGWYGKLKEWTEIYKQNIPEGVYIQLPDIQSPFNSSHLIRGNDILTDFFDDPEAVEALLDKVTDFMIKLVHWLKSLVNNDTEWFFDYGALWKGSARISNCSMHMISPKMYLDHVLPRDMRFMKAIGGGRIHYCGTQEPVIKEFMKNPDINGLDFDGHLHDLWNLADLSPKKLILLQWGEQDKTVARLLKGDWPEKRNIIFTFNAESVDEGKKLLEQLRNSWAKV
jgi:Uroporphyrinogen-III decarboxylase